jgi:hypothetical protein
MRYEGRGGRMPPGDFISAASWSESFSFEDLEQLFVEVDRLVWTIAAYPDGSDDRDGVENTTLAAIAGWFLGRKLRSLRCWSSLTASADGAAGAGAGAHPHCHRHRFAAQPRARRHPHAHRSATAKPAPTPTETHSFAHRRLHEGARHRPDAATTAPRADTAACCKVGSVSAAPCEISQPRNVAADERGCMLTCISGATAHGLTRP